ncbi:MAG: DNA polymerase III subunit gamma/tau [Flavobacterium sp.]|uniref:DNA polymerase III subunit gamma/tau n=1 Tax=Flavobacterium sp. TaxID=239 RepID=UPI0022BC2D68|nr:DNA polymerase III subunit gamma/tau [Flavobacterium sp.]MCZ8168459.1 DNA polymerase III subunit gamma/tau [Flavobacterium sp.]MCZ8296593.1 DNA polymerase III subunit gamma/tau [Flavobacterium sp.]
MQPAAAVTPVSVPIDPPKTEAPRVEPPVSKPLQTILPSQTEGGKVSALSLSSIRAKKELLEQQKNTVREEQKTLPTEPFTATEMLEQWYKYADRLNDKGHKIMEALLRINDPRLEGTTIIHTLPNQGSKLDFDKEKPELVAFLRAKLHNHEIGLEVEVNEEVKSKIAFTPQDKYHRLQEINPALEMLRKQFDLDL